MNVRTFILFLFGWYLGGLLWTRCARAEAALAKPARSYSLGLEGLPPLVELDLLDFRYQKYADRRDAYAPQYDNQFNYQAGLDWNLSLLKYGFWRNDVAGNTLQSGQFKQVYWFFQAGLRIPVWHLELYREHKSEHIMDERPVERDGDVLPGKGTKFPVTDSWVIKYTIYDKANKR
jgi:hypothetical protein